MKSGLASEKNHVLCSPRGHLEVITLTSELNNC